MKQQVKFTDKRYASGMTLVEVLIAAVVIAVGLLGIASLQINALQSTTEAQQRSKATDVIAAIADRVKANPYAVDAYRGDIPSDTCSIGPTQPLPDIARCAMSPDGTVDVVTRCTQEEMAEYDLWEVNCQLQSIIPGAELSIDCPAGGCAPLQPMVIEISWQTQNRNPNEGEIAPEDTVTQAVAITIFPEFHDDPI